MHWVSEQVAAALDVEENEIKNSGEVLISFTKGSMWVGPMSIPAFSANLNQKNLSAWIICWKEGAAYPCGARIDNCAKSNLWYSLMTRMFPMTMETSYISYYRFYSSIKMSYIFLYFHKRSQWLSQYMPYESYMFHRIPPGLQAVLQALRAPTRPARCRRIQGIWWIWRRSQPRSEIMEVTPVLKSFKNGWLLQIGKWVMWYTKKKYKYYIYIYPVLHVYLYIYMGYNPSLSSGDPTGAALWIFSPTTLRTFNKEIWWSKRGSKMISREIIWFYIQQVWGFFSSEFTE